MEKLADFDHPLVEQTAARLVADAKTPRESLARIFNYVRDDIAFAFPPDGDFVKASDTIRSGYGQCNTKGTLFLALCKAAGIPARLHFSKITKEIQRGFFTGIPYALLPDQLSHSWIEVDLGGEWYAIDSYINDQKLHDMAVAELARRNWKTGFSVSLAKGAASADLVLDGAHFSQMAAVEGDDGVWGDPAQFYAQGDYRNKVGPIRQRLYRMFLPLINGRVARLREGR